ncbi:MAG: acyl-CoA thioesterase [Pseudorhodobacter sp.]
MTYDRIIAIEFNHCDPAGIVFYPRYFEMTNSVVENFFADVLHYPFSRITLEEGRGVPTVRIALDFHAPSRLGEKLRFTLAVTRVGGASVGFHIAAEAGGITRLEADFTLVWISAEGRAEPWPETLRARLTDFMERS